MFGIILLLTSLPFIIASANCRTAGNDLEFFLKKLSEDYKNYGMEKILLDFKEEWAKVLDSGKQNASESERTGLENFLVKLDHVFKTGKVVDEKVVEEEWKKFEKEFEFEYPAMELSMRKEIFLENAERTEEHNELFREGKSTYEMGLNDLAAMTDEEYRERNDLKAENITVPDQNSCRPERVRRQSEYPIKPTRLQIDPNFRLPSSVDWRRNGLVGPVENQGQCGSCYAFSAVGQLEALFKHTAGYMIKLSEQDMVDCTTSLGNSGCHGGWMHKVFQYVQKHGILTAADYPYTHSVSQCRHDPRRAQHIVDGFVAVPSGDEHALMYAVARYGPISIALDANTRGFMLYKSGVFNDPQCTRNINHAVLLVGYGTDPKFGDYWIIRNSWGTSWGMEGYGLVARNRGNACGIASYAVFATRNGGR